ncbi:MAG TPA: pseudouridine synthase [Prosthecobacter sp.]|nr:pseudouridine synthase [Prosthecobacter sp.]HRK13417.1 pseudouridine synthase [Prosthecobacter sp.]
MRLNRYLSLCGLGSRRGVETLILEGRVCINGHYIRDLATDVSDEDKVTVDGRPARAETPVVLALNKPRGYICSRSDERDRMTIYALLPRQYQHLHHAGRLDKESEGLLLLTNRGDLSHRLIHPSQGAEKEYEVVTDKPMDLETMNKLVHGMMTEEGHAKAERAWLASEYRAHVVLKQGLKRQIRLMFYQLGFEVERLRRIRIGWLEIRGLPKGGWRELSEAEVERFFSKEGGTGRASTNTDKPVLKRRAARTEERGAKDERRKPKFEGRKRGERKPGKARPATGRPAFKKPGAKGSRKRPPR